MTESITNSISFLRASSRRIVLEGWTIEKWNNGVIFLESPTGEGTEVDPKTLALYLAWLFETSF